MSDIEFIPGLIAKAPGDKAPEYVKCKLSIKRAELLAWLESQPDEWINGEVKVSRNGKMYVQRDTWKPSREEPRKATGGSTAGDDDSIPFAPLSKRTHWE